MHARGWRSIYCMPHRPAFKGSAPINLSDRLNQVLRWALGSVEILLSRHCPIWYGYGGRLKWLERLAYINTTIYPITAIPLLAYCTLPAVCLLTGKFIIPQVSNILYISGKVGNFMRDHYLSYSSKLNEVEMCSRYRVLLYVLQSACGTDILVVFFCTCECIENRNHASGMPIF